MKYETLRLVDLAPIEVPVEIDGKLYTLKEASEGAAVEYQNLMLAATKFGADMKPTGVDGMANGEPLLVSRCLYLDGKPVPIATILAWPARIVKPIFELAREISGMKVEETAESIKSQIAKLEEKLAGLEPKNGQLRSMAISSSAASLESSSTN